MSNMEGILCNSDDVQNLSIVIAPSCDILPDRTMYCHFRCSSCHYEMTSDDLEDQAYFQLENTTHLLHGVVHANGFGHLLRVNGREGGSKFLKGSDIMSFWDSLCKVLRVRYEYIWNCFPKLSEF